MPTQHHKHRQTARISTGGAAPKKRLATQAARAGGSRPKKATVARRAPPSPPLSAAAQSHLGGAYPHKDPDHMWEVARCAAGRYHPDTWEPELLAVWKDTWVLIDDFGDMLGAMEQHQTFQPTQASPAQAKRGKRSRARSPAGSIRCQNRRLRGSER
ncbi:hypothetical protein OC835_003016 [Tilletia horrida]|nr:hypothetical protein OC835_003016 [Tilletia horrida]